MSNPPDYEPESDAVLAFIHAQQGRVLDSAIVKLSSCAPEDLRDVVHAIHGTLGSYRLDDAHAAITTLSEILASPGSPAEDDEEARQQALDTLRRLAAGVRT